MFGTTKKFWNIAVFAITVAASLPDLITRSETYWTNRDAMTVISSGYNRSATAHHTTFVPSPITNISALDLTPARDAILTTATISTTETTVITQTTLTALLTFQTSTVGYGGSTLTTLPLRSGDRGTSVPHVAARPTKTPDFDYPPGPPDPTLKDSNYFATCLGAVYGMSENCDSERLPPSVT